jgi:ABC-2 type transport system ATP-binding protein
MLAIQTYGLSRYFGKTAAVEDVTLEVQAGEVLGFLGPNGAGAGETSEYSWSLVDGFSHC